MTIVELEKETHSDIVLDHNNFWDNPTQPKSNHNVRQIKTHTVYTEEEVKELLHKCWIASTAKNIRAINSTGI